MDDYTKIKLRPCVTDLNLDGLPCIECAIRDYDATTGDGPALEQELRQLVERERAAVAEDCDACQKNHSVWWDSTLPAWAKPVMLELRKLVKAYDALTEEQKEEIEQLERLAR